MLHGLSLRDAAIVSIEMMTTVYKEPMARARAWSGLAKDMGIAIVEDEELRAQRLAAEHAKIDEFFGDG